MKNGTLRGWHKSCTQIDFADASHHKEEKNSSLSWMHCKEHVCGPRVRYHEGSYFGVYDMKNYFQNLFSKFVLLLKITALEKLIFLKTVFLATSDDVKFFDSGSLPQTSWTMFAVLHFLLTLPKTTHHSKNY